MLITGHELALDVCSRGRDGRARLLHFGACLIKLQRTGQCRGTLLLKWSLRVLLLSHLVHIGLSTDSLSMGRPAPW